MPPLTCAENGTVLERFDHLIPGLIIAAPSSGSGKTTITLSLLRVLKRHGIRVSSLKVGPDYIDPAFHAAASSRTCLNLDLWAMRPDTATAVVDQAADGAELLVAEGVMGLFDGAVTDEGSTADVASLTGWPVVLVVDAQGMAASAAALVRGFATHRADVQIAGVIFNRIGSERHLVMLERAMEPLGIPVFGALKRNGDLKVPARHLGLVQASEHAELDAFLELAADALEAGVNWRSLLEAAAFGAEKQDGSWRLTAMKPPGQHTAVAADKAFAFSYPALLDEWRRQGAEVSLFSPLNDEEPSRDADAVYLPGGYPELYAGQLANNQKFLDGVRHASVRGACVFGECGGYMILGDALIDADGKQHAMCGLLPLATSFAERKLSLGYRRATVVDSTVPARARRFLPAGARVRGHEFHYATVVSEGDASALFACESARGDELGTMGLSRGNVFGSFLHLVDEESERQS